MIKYTRLLDGKVYTTWEECERDNSSKKIKIQDDICENKDKTLDKINKKKKVRNLFNI